MFFHSPAAANKATGLHLTTIKTILERGGNPIYHRKFDNKLFEIRKEDPIRLIMIEGEDFFSLEEIQAKFGLSPTKFLNQVKNDQFAKKIDWISPELFPGNESETEKIDELEILRSQFEKFQEKRDLSLKSIRQRLIGFPPKLKRWKKKRLLQGSFAPRKQSQKFSILPELLTRYVSILNLWRSSSEMGLLTYALMDPKLTDMFSLTTKENIFLIW